MAELARFDGIIIRMYPEAGGRHHRAHLHAYYGEHEAVYTISPIKLIEGKFPNSQHDKVVAWATKHQAELLAAWKNLRAGRTVGKIQ
jgi:hypothetical protein